MKIKEVIAIKPEQQKVDALNKTADAAKKRAKVASASLQVKKAQEKLRQAVVPATPS